MFRVDEYVVHKSGGVCRIVDIRKEEINGNEIEFYVLQSVYGNMIIKTPVTNPKGLVREIITKDSVLALIAGMADKKTSWIKDGKQRSTFFNESLKSGESKEWIELIKMVYCKKEAEPAAVKKTDEELMKRAERQLYEEFAVALNISPEEVLPYILRHVPSTGHADVALES